MNTKNKDTRPRTILEQARVANMKQANEEEEIDSVDEFSEGNTTNLNQPIAPAQSNAMSQPVIQPQVKQQEPQVIVQKQKKGFNLMGCLGWIRNCGCLLILLLCCGSIFIIVSKPQGIWNAVVNFLNDGYAAPKNNSEALDVNAIQNQLNSQLQSIGEQTIIITEDQLAALVSSKVAQLPNLAADIEPNEVILSWDLDKTIEGNPLKGIVVLSTDTNEKIIVKHVGVKRLNMPDAVNQFVTDQFYKVASNLTNKDSQFALLQNIIPANGITVKSISIEKDQLKVVLDVRVDLFNQ